MEYRRQKCNSAAHAKKPKHFSTIIEIFALKHVMFGKSTCKSQFHLFLDHCLLGK